MIILLAGILFFGVINGNPIMNQLKTPETVSMETRDKSWTPIENSWSPSSIGRFFHYVDSDKNEMLLMKKRIENMERSQREIYELLKKITKNGSSNCQIIKDLHQSTLEIKEDKKLIPVISKTSSSSPPTSTSASTLISVSASSVSTNFTSSSSSSLSSSSTTSGLTNIDFTIEDAKS